MNNTTKKAFFAVWACCLLVFSCSNNVQEVRDLGIKKAGREEANVVTAYMSEASRLRAKLTAPLMLHETQDTAKMIFPKTLHVDFYNDSTGVVDSKLFAKYAVNYENLNKVLMRDSVVVFNMTGDSLHTNELWWDRNRQLFYTDKWVHVRQQGNDIYGVGMTSDQAFKDVHILHPTGKLAVPDSTLPAQ
jgi:LPS export ABC transporter protein LptC